MANTVAQIDQARCSGCGRCISACEFRLFSFEVKAWRKTAVMHDLAKCSGCGECVARCATGALSLQGLAVAEPNANQSACQCEHP